MRLAGKRAVVTGASQGMGLEIAKALSREGAHVVVNARGSGEKGAAQLAAAAEETSAAGNTAMAFAGDVSEPGVAEALIGACVDRFGGIDILINNAGVHDDGTIDNCSVEEWHRTMKINLDGPFLTCRAAAPHMKQQRWGRIINATSGAAYGGNGGTSYPASKAGLIGLTYAMARDLGMYGVTVNAYNPQARTRLSDGTEGEANTGQFQAMMRSFKKRGFYTDAKLQWILGMCPTDGIPPWLVYLCLNEANYINGEVFFVDGRRVGLVNQPEEVRTLLQSYNRHGPFDLEELIQNAPTFFPLENRWPLKSDEDIADALAGL